MGGGGESCGSKHSHYSVLRIETEHFGVAVFCRYPVPVPAGALSIMSDFIVVFLSRSMQLPLP